jgi:hypothetical protein
LKHKSYGNTEHIFLIVRRLHWLPIEKLSMDEERFVNVKCNSEPFGENFTRFTGGTESFDAVLCTPLVPCKTFILHSTH